MSRLLHDFVNRDGQNFIGYCSSAANICGPAILMINEDFSSSNRIKRIADVFAERGYIVLVPNISEYFDHGPTKKSINHNAPQTLPKFEPVIDFDPAIMQIKKAINVAKSIPKCNGNVGIVGFSSGATLAYLAAARLDPDAAIAYFSGRLHNFLNEGKNIICPLLIHLYELGDLARTQDNNKIEAALIGKGNISIHTYNSGDNLIKPYGPVLCPTNDINSAHQRTFKLMDRLK